MLTLRIIIDVMMAITWLLTLEYKILGMALHEYVGLTLFACFIVHILLNWRWFANLTKGTYNTTRLLRTTANLALIVCIIVVIATVPFVSRVVYTDLSGSLPLGVWKLIKGLHKGAGKLGFVLLVLHVFFHWTYLRNVLGKIFGSKDKDKARLANIK